MMNHVIKYKVYYLLSNRFVILSTVILFLLLNFQAIVNSGILFSGGADFNAPLKYTLLLNNYVTVASFYGLLLSIFLGSSIIGPDMQTGNMYIIMSAYPSRIKYFLGTYLAVFFYMAVIQLVLLLNILILFLVYNVSFLWSDVFVCFIQIFLNALVVLSVTGLASIYIKDHNSAFVGLFGYAFFNVYTFNQIPFINTEFVFDITRYKDILCNFFPIVHVLPPSYSSLEAVAAYSIRTVIPNVSVYQGVFAIAVVGISCFCFKKKELR